MERAVVVGAGLAGFQTVVALRGLGYSGRLTLVGAERHLPYDRPPLSKAVLRGEADSSALDADWDALDVELLLGRRATGLRDGVVETDGGPLDHDGAVLATGSVPRALPGSGASGTSGAAGPRVHLLRTIEDSLALRADLRAGARVVVVGAGWIGAEVATAAATAGCAVTVVEALDAPLAGALPAELGRLTLPWYAEAGIQVRLGAAVDVLEAGAVHLVGGERLAADTVVVGIGVRPATDWLVGSAVALGVDGTVTVDERLSTSAPQVYAAGDCAAWWSRRYGVRLHVEHWDDALHAPTVAAANLLGRDVLHDPVPYFWSEQLGRMVQYAGHHPAGDRLLWRGEPGTDATWTACWLRGDRLVAVLAVGRPRDLVQGRRVIERGGPVDEARLADPSVPVKAAQRSSPGSTPISTMSRRRPRLNHASLATPSSTNPSLA